ncbi:MAG: EMC3/TMCO1 family protein [Candidatus Marsarchaeota archaeon]|nr:EMC3/TMCO1 family protein [Candidatus Marsarchaeota archaeon]
MESLAVWIIFAVGVAYALLSQFIIQKVGNPKRLKEIQAESARLNKQMQEAVKSKDEGRIQRADKEYKDFMPKISEMMFIQMKPMIVVLPILLLLGPALKQAFSNFVITLPFQLPIVIQNLEKFPNWRDTFGAYGWFYLSVFVAGLAISLIKGAWEKYAGGRKTPQNPIGKTESQGPSS